MMRTLPTRSASTSTPSHSSNYPIKTPLAPSAHTNQAGPVPPIPSIRLISATPSASGVSSSASGSEASSSFVLNRSLEETWAAMAPTIGLVPKDDQEPRRKLVPKKSKLSLLSIGMGKGRDQKREERARDLSDVVRRVGVNPNTGSVSGNGAGTGSGAFEIYVDPAVDPDIGDIVVVKKKKSRLALDGLAWSAPGANGAMAEVTNVPKTRAEGKEKENVGMLKVKGEEGQKWWTIGRGRKDSKEEKKEKKEKKENFKISHKPIEYIHDPNPPRSKTPEPFKPSQDTQGRGRFNSLDSGFLLSKNAKGNATASHSPISSLRGYGFQPGPAAIIPMPMDDEVDQDEHSTHSTPGLLNVPGSQNQGSIALRAIRSVRSLARMGSWAQLNDPALNPTKEKTTDEKKDRKIKKKSKSKEGEDEKDEKKKSIRKKSTKGKKEKDEKVKKDTVRQSSSSFEIGALSTSPGPATPATPGFVLSPSPSSQASTLGVGSKKSTSILGLGLPSTIRLPSVSRLGSSASSMYNIEVSPPTGDPVTNSNSNRLSVESATHNNPTARPTSIMSSGSSLRPLSAASTNSGSRLSVSSHGESKRSSSACSVRWDEEGLETVREQRKKERESMDSLKKKEMEERRTSRESRRSSEGRRRTPLTSVFPEVRKSLEEVEIGNRMLRGEMTVDEEMVEERKFTYPILTIEEATADGHDRPDDWDEPIEDDDSANGEEMEEDEDKAAATPVKKARPRPVSEQMLGRSRPKPMYEDDEGVLSILDAATNDLALLINNLDLQATPSSAGGFTPLRPSPGSGIYEHSPTPVSTLEKPKSSNINGSPKRRQIIQPESPLTAKKAKASPGLLSRQMSTSSISSIRPYAQSRGYPSKKADTIQASNKNMENAALVNQNIVPWATLIKGLSPVKEKGTSTQKLSPSAYVPPTSSSTFRPSHKRTMTPGPEPEPELVLQPLRPARSRAALFQKDSMSRLLQLPSSPETVDSADLKPLAFNSSTGDIGVSDTFSGSLAPVFKRMNDEDHRRFGDNLNVSRSSRGGSSSKSSRSSYGSQIQTTFDDFAENRAPLTLQARRVHGMSGTLGGSDTSCYRLPSDADMDVSDPDSDVPDELKVILAGSEDRRSFMERDDAETGREGLDDEDTHEETGTNRLIVCRSERPPSLPLELPSLPIFHASLIDTHNNEQQLGLDCPSSPTSTAEQDIDHTNKSFDFTGELERLNSSGASDRRSFVEQLENAFKTPAKVDLRYAFDLDLIPPVPTIDLGRYANTVTTEGSNVLSEDESAVDRNSGSGFEYGLVPESVSQLVDMQLPSLSLMEKSGLNADSQNGTRSSFGMFSGANANSKLVDVKEPTDIHDDGDSIAEEGNTSRTSNGELNTSFRFGGLPRDDSMSLRSSHSNVDNKALTLSDIIPPPMHARALSITSSSKDLNDVDSFMLDELEDDSVLKSIYAKIMAGPLVKGTDTKVDQELKAKPRPTRKEQRDSRRSIYRAPSRPTSGISFEGFSSFDEVRRGFEFSRDRPAFYPPPLPNQSTSTNADFTFSFSATSNTSNANNVSSRRVPHRRHESALSFASVSSYGHVVLNAGSHDPFDYAQLPILRERPSNEDMTAISSIAMSMSVDDTFAHIRNHPRRRVDSDASSFYFKPTQRGHHRRESNMSVSSQAPPISLFNRSFGHRRNDSSVSASSVAMSYIRHGANGGISAWSRHRRFESNMSVDSIMSDFSAMHLGRPGLGDKMFDNDSYGHVPLSAISASPPGSTRSDRSAFNDDSNTGHLEQYQSSSMSDRHPYDSIIDGPEEPKSSMVDSIFDKTGYQPHRSSVSSESLFGNNIGDDFVGYYGNNPTLFASNQYRPLSVLSRNSVHSPIKEDDTMISMLGGGHVRRRSVVEASPCARVEKRKHVNTAVRLIKGKDFDEDYHNNESPNKARVVEKPSIASTSSFQFGNERMIKAQRGLLERQSLEDSCLIADGEEAVIATATYHSVVPVFTRPVPPGRSRSSTCTSSSSGQDTPPLSNASDASSSDASSISGGSQSSIDLSEINIALSNVTHPSVSRQSRTTGIGLRQRARARGTGHRRRYSNAHMSRSSVYETIEEEVASNANSGSVASSPSNSMSLPASITKNKLTSKDESPTTRQSIYIVDSDTASLSGIQGVDDGTEYTTTTWDDEHGIVALRKFYALRDEAQCTVSESRRVWKDTPFSVFAVQSFQAPGSPAGMRALLQHSVQTYGPLPSELRPHRVRSRTNSRASPYPKPQPSRLSKSSVASEQTIPVPMPLAAVAPDNKTPPIRILQDVTINPNTAPRPSKQSDAPSLAALKPFTPFNVDVKSKENGKGSKVEARPRVGSNARRTALGWTKRSNGPSAATGTVKKTSNGQKENINMDAIGAGTIMTPGENLRLNRPRPRGRPTPAGRTPASVKPIRI